MSSIFDWSTTAANNASSDSAINWAEGQAPSTVNNSARAVMGRLAEFVKDIGGTLTAGGTANAVTVTANSAFTSYATGQLLAFKAASDNTGATTLSVNAIGAKSIRKFTADGEAALTGGEIQQDGLFLVMYNTALNSGAGGWYLINPTLTSLGSSLTLTSTDAGIGVGPVLTLYRDSASPAASDNIGAVRFSGEDSAGNTEIYAQIYAKIADPTSTSEDASIRFQVDIAGTITEVAQIDETGLTLTSADAGATLGPTLVLYRNSASPAASDFIGGVDFQGEDSAGNTETYARIVAQIADATSTSEDANLLFQADVAGTLTTHLTLQGGLVRANVGLAPATDGAISLGAASGLRWAALNLASGAPINWNNGDVTVTHSANTLAFAGASSGYTFDADVTAGDNYRMGSAGNQARLRYTVSGVSPNRFALRDDTLAADVLSFDTLGAATFLAGVAATTATFSGAVSTGTLSSTTGAFSGDVTTAINYRLSTASNTTRLRYTTSGVSTRFALRDDTLGTDVLAFDVVGAAAFTLPPRVPSYTVAGAPSASTSGAGATIYVSNEAGGAVLAFSDGTNWRRVTDRAVIS